MCLVGDLAIGILIHELHESRHLRFTGLRVELELCELLDLITVDGTVAIGIVLVEVCMGNIVSRATELQGNFSLFKTK